MRWAALAALVAAAGLPMPAGAAAGAAPDDGPLTEVQEADRTLGGALRTIGLALGAAIAIAGAGLATARVQAAVGAGGAGAIAEKPELFGRILILYAIPETIVVLGFVIALVLWVRI
jgi:V/A-type H+-transporting ATPase subunit K